MHTLILGVAALMLSQSTVGPNGRTKGATIAPAAKIEVPPTATKLALIRPFLRVIGRQDQLDSGSFLERYAIPGGPMWPVQSGSKLTENLTEGFGKLMAALKSAYEKHRSAYQGAYESHVSWEVTEKELDQIVEFLEGPVGKHYLDGRWRMEAYVGTNTEELEEQIVTEAQARLAK